MLWLLDHQQNREVIEDRGDGRHHQDLQIGDLQEFRDEKGRRPERRRREQRADACSREHRARGLGAVAGAPQQRPRHRSQHHRRGHTAARHGAEEESGDRHRPAGCGYRPAAHLQRPFDEEGAGTARVQQRTVDREQDDVGCGDVERHAEDSFERHVERADQSCRTVSAMRDQVEPDPVQQRAGPRVQQECERGCRQHPPDRAAGRFEHEPDGDGSENQIDGGRLGRAIDELPEIDQGPDESDRRESDENPIGERHAIRRAQTRGRRIQQERQNQRNEKEGDPVDLRLDDEEDPVDRVRRKTGGRQRRDSTCKAGRRPHGGSIRLDAYSFHTPFSRYSLIAPG